MIPRDVPSLLKFQVGCFTVAAIFIFVVGSVTPDTIPGPIVSTLFMAAVFVAYCVCTLFSSNFVAKILLAVLGLFITLSVLSAMFRTPPCDGYYNRVSCVSLNLPLIHLGSFVIALFVILGLVAAFDVIKIRSKPVPKKRR